MLNKYPGGGMAMFGLASIISRKRVDPDRGALTMKIGLSIKSDIKLGSLAMVLFLKKYGFDGC
jgi:hypothetical protein